MNETLARATIEYTALTARLDRMEKFLLGPGYQTLPQEEKDDLQEQVHHMRGYLKALSRRYTRLLTDHTEDKTDGSKTA